MEISEGSSAVLQLRKQFLDELPVRKQHLEQLWRNLALDPNDQALRQELQDGAHRLIGACDCFDFHDISNVLRQIIEGIFGERAIASTGIEAMFWGIDLWVAKAKDHPVDSEETLPFTVASSSVDTDRILVVEPDEESRLELTKYLRLCRYRPVAHSSFAEVEEMSGVLTIIADINEVQKSLAQLSDRSNTSLLISSKTGSFEERLQAVRLKASGFFTKPFDVERIVEFLDRSLLSSSQEPFRVLLIDDDKVVGALLAEYLKLAGMRIRLLNDVCTVLDELQEWHPDVLVMDGMSVSFDVAKLIRQVSTYIGLPMVYLSSNMSLSAQIQSIDAGVDDILRKGLPREHLVTVLEHRAARFRKLRTLTELDSLTGLLNHTRIKERMVLEIARAKRENCGLSMAMIDIDFFKTVNDRYGHLVGDQVIKALARLLRERFRTTDAVGRYGGEEFAVIMPRATEDNAWETIERLRDQFQQLVFSFGGVDFSVTLSAGIAEFHPDQDASTFNYLADQALYLAKNSGRNCVRKASELD